MKELGYLNLVIKSERFKAREKKYLARNHQNKDPLPAHHKANKHSILHNAYPTKTACDMASAVVSCSRRITAASALSTPAVADVPVSSAVRAGSESAPLALADESADDSDSDDDDSVEDASDEDESDDDEDDDDDEDAVECQRVSSAATN